MARDSVGTSIGQRARQRFSAIAFCVISVVALASQAAESLTSQAAWMLSYAGGSTNALFWDKRTNAVIRESLPPRLSGKVLEALGGPPNPVIVVGPTLSASACVAHSCPDKGFFWIDTASGIAFGASASLWGCEEATGNGLPCDLFLGSRRISAFHNIPPAGKQALMAWMNEQGIRVRKFRFVGPTSATTELDPADFRLPERFHPSATGPSFDCRRALSRIEKAICGNPDLAKLDLEMADLYEQMRRGYDTVGDRDQLRDLQRAWLAHRSAACPGELTQVRCLEVEYQRHHDVLENWIPTEEMPKN
ncbi:MAG TPA: lysozyme inhibitor LprI family protein [Candidatus Sulfotelmatobacter sp.]|nr:lysozyme inhibitor LprI family protein [Candidatus Sulfotelmatobacter sp.]